MVRNKHKKVLNIYFKNIHLTPSYVVVLFFLYIFLVILNEKYLKSVLNVYNFGFICVLLGLRKWNWVISCRE